MVLHLQLVHLALDCTPRETLSSAACVAVATAAQTRSSWPKSQCKLRQPQRGAQCLCLLPAGTLGRRHTLQTTLCPGLAGTQERQFFSISFLPESPAKLTRSSRIHSAQSRDSSSGIGLFMASTLRLLWPHLRHFLDTRSSPLSIWLRMLSVSDLFFNSSRRHWMSVLRNSDASC